MNIIEHGLDHSSKNFLFISQVLESLHNYKIMFSVESYERPIKVFIYRKVVYRVYLLTKACPIVFVGVIDSVATVRKNFKKF